MSFSSLSPFPGFSLCLLLVLFAVHRNWVTTGSILHVFKLFLVDDTWEATQALGR